MNGTNPSGIQGMRNSRHMHGIFGGKGSRPNKYPAKLRRLQARVEQESFELAVCFSDLLNIARRRDLSPLPRARKLFSRGQSVEILEKESHPPVG